MVLLLNTILFLLYFQGDADYLRYRGMQEFDQAMQHLEGKYEVSHFLLLHNKSSKICMKQQQNICPMQVGLGSQLIFTFYI